MSRNIFEMKYGVERLNTNSTKWDGIENKFGEKNLIPMWVADMDFKSSEKIIEKFSERVNHGIFGYYEIPDSYYNSFIKWELEKHNFKIDRKNIRFSPGVVTGIYWLVNILTEKNDAIIVSTPVYYPFHNAVKENERILITSDLINKNGIYEFDYEDFENKIKEFKVKMYILCSPHNPVGRVWKEDELKKIIDICKKYNIIIVSDEIHQDLVFEKKHIPTGVIGKNNYEKNIITLTSASKSFNLAGLKNSFVVINNLEILKKFDEFTTKIIRVTNGSIFGYIATEAAYTYGNEWLSNLVETIKDNYEYMYKTLKEALPNIIISPLEGTYLSWLDLRYYLKNEELEHVIQKKCKLAVDYGEWFGECGKGFIRINIATDRKYLVTALENIIKELS
ncbi:MAG: MalY/PatB family protein [Fusobacteriaceae bacterium]